MGKGQKKRAPAKEFNERIKELFKSEPLPEWSGLDEKALKDYHRALVTAAEQLTRERVAGLVREGNESMERLLSMKWATIAEIYQKALVEAAEKLTTNHASKLEHRKKKVKLLSEKKS